MSDLASSRPDQKADPIRSIAARLRTLPDALRRPVAASDYNAEIDGLRFIAIAIVVVGHFMERATRFFPVLRHEIDGTTFGTLVQRPGLGVYLFFAISGFVITRQARKARMAPLSPAFLKTYFGRRVLRIEPPYILLLVATWALIAVSGYRPEQTNHFDALPHSITVSLAGSIAYVHDLVWGTYPRLFPPGWSLEIEVQFYVLAPVLLFVLFAPRGSWLRLAIGGIGLFVGAILSSVAPDRVGLVHTDASILRFFHFFWFGMLVAVARNGIVAWANRIPPLAAGMIGWLGLVGYLVMPGAPADDLSLAFAIRAAILAMFGAMFVGAFAMRSSFHRFCAARWISVIGGACYSLYLVHLQTIQGLTSFFAKLAPNAGLGMVSIFLLIEVFAVVVVGMVFYVVIERTFMAKDWPQRFWRWLRAPSPLPLRNPVRVRL